MIILVPHLNGIEDECEQGLRQLEIAGVKVWRRRGSSQIDIARNEMISAALHDNFTSMMFIDADISFNHADAIKLINHPEPVISGIYAKKGLREMASIFTDKEVIFGLNGGIYPLHYAATGFLCIKAFVLQKMITVLKLPLCNTKWGKGIWPFFQPLITEDNHYLGEDWAFSYRLHQIGVTPFADTTIRLYHWGNYGYSWEDAGNSIERFQSYKYGA